MQSLDKTRRKNYRSTDEYYEEIGRFIEQQQPVIDKIPQTPLEEVNEATDDVHASLLILKRRLEQRAPADEIEVLARAYITDIEYAYALVVTLMAGGLEPNQPSQDKLRIDDPDYIISQAKSQLAEMEKQMQEGLFYREDLDTLDEWKQQIEKYEEAVEDGQEVFIALELRRLEDLTMQLAREILASKRRRNLN